MPAQKPHRSVQDVKTPPEFLAPVQARFGTIGLDLAATNDNAVARTEWGATYFGPDHELPERRDALAADWSLARVGLAWLNPPYANILPWAAKCAAEAERGLRVAMLVPASVGANWFNSCVRPFAYVLELTPRLTFVGHSHAYPKDLILAVYTPERFVGREAWHWKPVVTKAANDNGVDPRQMILPTMEHSE